MDNIFDVAPFPYVGNNKHYREITKDELDTLKANMVKESCASGKVEENAIVNMLPQVELTSENDVPDVEDVLADAEEEKVENLFDDEEIDVMQLDEEFDLLKESLNDEVNGSDIYFESSKFIDAIKAKFKKKDTNEINYSKIMKAAKAYTDLKFVEARKKIAVTKDSSIKDTIEFKKYQKKAINAEKDFRKFKADLTEDEVKILNDYIENFNNSFADKIELQIKDIKDAKKAAVKTESCETEGCNSEIVTEKDIDPGMKPILDKLHSKGYKTKASSSGHKNVTVKKDGDEDNVAKDHHYGDARLVFDGKYNFGKAPKYWYWKKVDNADEVEYLDIMQIKKDEWPDNGDKFAAWKAGYMKSLTDWVDGLPSVSDEKKEVEEACCKESGDDFDNLNTKIRRLQKRIDTNERLQSEWMATHGEENSSLLKQHDEMCDEMDELTRRRRAGMTESTDDINEQIDTLYESVVGSLMFDVLDI